MIDWGKLLPMGVAVIASGLLAHECNRARSLQGELSRVREARALAAQGVPVETAASRKDLEKALAGEKSRSASFASALAEAEEKIKAATGKPPKVVEVVRWRTVTGMAHGASRIEPSGSNAPSGPAVPGGPPPDCLLAMGDRMAIEVSEARLETRAGNRIAVGSARCLRVTPNPAELFEAPIEMNLTAGKVLEAEVKPEKSSSSPYLAGITGSIVGRGDLDWGVGPLIGLAGSRFGAAASITFPNEVATLSVFGRF